MDFKLYFIGYTQDGEKLTEKILEEYDNCKEKTPLELSASDKCDIIDNYPEIATARIMFVYFEQANIFYSKRRKKQYAILDFWNAYGLSQYVFEYNP